jgi:hypothetical protein
MPRQLTPMRTVRESGANCVHIPTTLYSHLSLPFVLLVKQNQDHCYPCLSIQTNPNNQHACLCRCSHLPSHGPLHRSTLQQQIIQVLKHHRQHILHLLRRCHPHRQRLRPNPLQLQHFLWRQPYCRRLRRSFRQRSNPNALTEPHRL